jgi:hypothetical protein
MCAEMQHFAWYVEISCVLIQSAVTEMLKSAQDMQMKVVFLDWLCSQLNKHHLSMIFISTTDLVESVSSVADGVQFTVHIGQFQTIYLCCSQFESGRCAE